MEYSAFKQLSALIYNEAGITLPDEKQALLENRIAKRLRALGIDDANAYLDIVKSLAGAEELVLLIDAISTNVTSFYREPSHFEMFAEQLAVWRAPGRRKLRVWCAAASSGQEPYTLAITVAENLPLTSLDFKLLGTDISTRMLEEASQAIYTDSEIEKVPENTRRRFFNLLDRNERESNWQVKDDIKQHVAFKRLNLSQFPFPLKGPIDFIFCRNVMIYFDRTLRQKIVNEFVRLLAPGGYLFLSHSESLIGIDHPLRAMGDSVFQRPER